MPNLQVKKLKNRFDNSLIYLYIIIKETEKINNNERLK